MYNRGMRVPPRSRSEIELLASTVRKACGYSDTQLAFPVMDFLEHKLATFIPGFCYDVREDGTLKDGARALTLPDRHLVLIEASVYDGACTGLGKDRMTISHEIGHIFLHEGVSLPKKYDTIEPQIYEDAEWQADVFAGELLAPIRLIYGMSSGKVSAVFQVSQKAAEAQLRALNKKLHRI